MEENNKDQHTSSFRRFGESNSVKDLTFEEEKALLIREKFNLLQQIEQLEKKEADLYQRFQMTESVYFDLDQEKYNKKVIKFKESFKKSSKNEEEKDTFKKDENRRPRNYSRDSYGRRDNFKKGPRDDRRNPRSGDDKRKLRDSDSKFKKFSRDDGKFKSDRSSNSKGRTFKSNNFKSNNFKKSDNKGKGYSRSRFN